MSTQRTLGNLSPEIVEVLRISGWVDPTADVVLRCKEEVKTCGFELNATAERVFETFGGSQITFPETSGVPWLHFDLSQPKHAFVPSDIENLTEVVGEKGCPVAGGGGYIILALESGKGAVLHVEWSVLLVAPTFAQLLTAIVRHDRSLCEDYPDVEQYRPRSF